MILNLKKISTNFIVFVIINILFINFIFANTTNTSNKDKFYVGDYGVKPRLIYDIIGNISGFLIYIAVPLSVIAVVLGGIHYILGGYKTDYANKGKKMIEKAIIGILVTLGGYGIIVFLTAVVNFIFNT